MHRHAHQKKYSMSLHLCLGCRLELQPCADCSNVGMNGSHHLLSLVSQMEKGFTIQSEQSPITNKRDIFAERHRMSDKRNGLAGKQTR